jgi:hypothetical protein
MRLLAIPRLTLAALLGLALPVAAEDPAVPPPPVAEVAPPKARSEDVPSPLPVPPGSKEDQELWTSCASVGNQLTGARWEGARLHWKIKTGEVHARLQEAAKADPKKAKQLDQVRAELLEAQVSSYGDLAGRWPIDKTRTCQYPQLDLGSAMQVASSRDNRAQLAQVREAAARCLTLARSTLRRVKGSTDALARALDAAEKALSTLPPVNAVPPAPPGK